jgi:hypothetical protein
MKISIKNTKTRIIITVTLMMMIVAFTKCKTSPSDKSNDTTNNKPALKLRTDIGVSLISLISNPERYNGKIVRVKGFLNIEFEGDAIYLHKEDFDLGLDQNSIWLSISKEDAAQPNFQNCNRKYVLIEGAFDSNNKGHNSRFNGAITKITRLEVLK